MRRDSVGRCFVVARRVVRVGVGVDTGAVVSSEHMKRAMRGEITSEEYVALAEAELERLREERETARRDVGNVALARMSRRAFAAEAEVQRLTEGLREIDKLDGRYHDLNTARWMARKTLDAASPDGANTEGGEA